MTHLIVVHPPQLDLPVVGPADDQRHAWMEVGPVDPPGGKIYVKRQNIDKHLI